MESSTTNGNIVFLKNSPLYENEKPYLVLLPPDADVDPSIPRHNLQFTTHNVSLYDVRSQCEHYHIGNCGFQFLQHKTSVSSLIQPCGPSLSDVTDYKTETEALLKEFFGAVHVVCYDFRLRENIPYSRNEIDLNDPLLREGPAKGAHNDVTARSGPEMIEHRLSERDFRNYRKPEYRFRIVNTWRSLNPRCEDAPLALCDYRTIHSEDLIPADRVIPERAGEVYYIMFNERQHWCWLRDQTPEEPVVFVMYDEQTGPQAKYCPHVSFENPHAPDEAVPRRSVETRSVVISKLESSYQ